MKVIMLLLLTYSQSVFSQVRHVTTTEEIISKGFYDWAYLNLEDVGFCSLPMVSRGEDDLFVNHRLVVETGTDYVTETRERIQLKTDDQFLSNDCLSHKQLVMSSIKEYGGKLPVTLYYIDKLVIKRGSYMGMPFCQKELHRTLEASIKSIRYFNTIKVSEESCNISTFNPETQDVTYCCFDYRGHNYCGYFGDKKCSESSPR